MRHGRCERRGWSRGCERGLETRDYGDREGWRWRPDRENRRAQNLDQVVEIVGDTAHRVAEAAGSGELTLVLGGDCTVGVGTGAGHSADGHRPGVVYFDERCCSAGTTCNQKRTKGQRSSG